MRGSGWDEPETRLFGEPRKSSRRLRDLPDIMREWSIAVAGSRIARDRIKKPAMNASEPVYMELVDFVARGVTPEDVANFRPSAEAQMRVADLLERQRESQLTDEETAELNGFVELENILGLAKAKAQLILAARS